MKTYLFLMKVSNNRAVGLILALKNLDTLKNVTGARAWQVALNSEDLGSVLGVHIEA